MVDFVGLLKRTIDAQSNATPALRQRIYDRTRETVERQMAGKDMPPDIIALQRRMLEKAVDEVEDFYGDNPAFPVKDQAAVFAALQRNAGIKPPAAAYPAAARRPQPGGRVLPDLSPYGYHPAEPDKTAAYGRMDTAAAGPSPYVPAAGSRHSFDELPPMSAAARDYGSESYRARAFAAAPGAMSAAPYDPYTAARPAGNSDSGRRFSLAEGAEDSGRFALYDDPAADNGGPAYHRSGRSLPGAFASEGYDNSRAAEAFARRSPDQPVPALPDFIADEPPALPQSENFYRPGSHDPAEAAAYRPYDAAHEEPRPAYSAVSTGFSAYGEPDYRPEGDTVTAPAGQPYPPAVHAVAAPDDRDFSPLPNLLFNEEAEIEETSAAAQSSGKAAGVDFSPLPDFLLSADEDNDEAGRSARAPAGSNLPLGEAGAFDLERALAAQQSGSAAPAAGGSHADIELPADFPDLTEDEIHRADVLLPEMQNGKSSRPAADEAGAFAAGAGQNIASGIFAQAAIREKRRSGKKRLITGSAIIVALLAIFGGIFWFLTDFLKNDAHSVASLVSKVPAVSAPETTAAEKAGQRLMPDGQEEEARPLQDTKSSSAAEKTAPLAEAAATGEVEFHEAQTALMPAASSTGTVKWSLLREKTPEATEDTILRGEITVPARDIFARLTLRPNHDSGIPAVYLAEIMFIVPENFEGVAVDKISPLMFKATAQSTGQELQDMRVYRINSNFFVIAMNTPEQGRNPKLQRNIALMEQLPWLTMNVAYKNGRIGEFNFAKGDKGDALFKQFFDAQTAAMQGMAPAAAARAPAP